MKKIKCPGYQPGTTSVPIEIIKLEDNSFHIIVKVEIDGIQGDMIIDTGASVTVIDQKLFPPKNDDPELVTQIQSGSVSGQIENLSLIKAGYLKIGGRKFKNIQLAGIDLDYVNEMYHKYFNRKIIGLLGCNFCVRYQVVIDYQTRKLVLNFRSKSKTKD